MPTAKITSTLSIGGVSMYSSITRTEEGQIGQEVTLPKATAGTLSTRTDDDTGVVTLASGHGLRVSDVVDVYWDAGIRYGMDVTAVNGDDVSVNLGAGDVLPAQDTAVTVSKQVTVNTDFDGDDMVMIGALAVLPGAPPRPAA
jgi:hypothetical protein